MALTDLIALRYPLVRQQREFRRKLEEIEEQVAERLVPLCEGEFRGLDDAELQATLIAVADSLEGADLSDRTLFRVDLDPIDLAREIRRQVPAGDRQALLSEPATTLYGVVLDQVCYYLAYLVLELPEFQSRAAVETLTRLTALAGQIGTVLERLPVANLDQVAGDDQDEEFRTRYFELVSVIYDRLELLGITTNYYEPTVTLTVAYLSLTASAVAGAWAQAPKSDAEPDRFPGYGGVEFRRQIFRVEDALGGRRRILLQGDAGAGKSTLLQWLAINAIRHRFAGRLADWNGLVPFVIRLRDFAEYRLPGDDEILLHANAPQWGLVPEGWVHRMAAAGKALFLVDGVDELPEQQRPKVREWLRAITTRYPGCRFVVTSRPSVATERWLNHDGYDTVTLEPMSGEDVRVFIDRWHSALLDAAGGHEVVLPCRTEDVPRHQRTLLANLDARGHLRALARNPLLCAMICALNLDRGAHLPRDRMTLYEAAMDMLLERRDAEKQVPVNPGIQLTAVQKRALLRALAWWLNENGRAEMSRDEALHQLRLKIDDMPAVNAAPTVVLEHLLERSGLIRQPVIGRIDFVHRTFQEFLAAKEVVERDSIDLLINNAHSDLWRETVLMACAHATSPQRGKLLNGIVDRAYAFYRSEDALRRRQLILLAAACLEIAVEVPTQAINRVGDCIRELLPPATIAEANTLATIGGVLFQVLPEDLRDMDETSASLVVRTVALSNEPTALDVLAAYAKDTRWAVQDELIECWRYFDTGHYARHVLAGAPLFDGALQVTDPDWLPHLSHLRRLRQVDVQIHPTELPDLRQFRSLNGLRNVLVRVRGDCDVAPLAQHNGLTYLNLRCGGRFVGLMELARLPQLRQLVLTATEPVADLGFARGLGSLTRLEVRPVGRSADVTPLLGLADLEWLALLDCHAPLDLASFAPLTSLRRLDLRGCSTEVDVSPLAGRTLTLRLDRNQAVRGLDVLGPNIEIQVF